jgi:hypothetical protein
VAPSAAFTGASEIEARRSGPVAVTGCGADVTATGFPHPGHLTRFPASSARTFKLLLHVRHRTTSIFHSYSFAGRSSLANPLQCRNSTTSVGACVARRRGSIGREDEAIIDVAPFDQLNMEVPSFSLPQVDNGNEEPIPNETYQFRSRDWAGTRKAAGFVPAASYGERGWAKPRGVESDSAFAQLVASAKVLKTPPRLTISMR